MTSLPLVPRLAGSAAWRHAAAALLAGGLGLAWAGPGPAPGALPVPVRLEAASPASAASEPPGDTRAAPARPTGTTDSDLAASASRMLAARDLAALVRTLGLEGVLAEESFGRWLPPAASASGGSWGLALDRQPAAATPGANDGAPPRGRARVMALAPAPAVDFVADLGRVDGATVSTAASMLATLAGEDGDPALPGLVPAGHEPATSGRVRPVIDAVASAVPVPEPAMLWMLLPGLLVVWAGVARRRG